MLRVALILGVILVVIAPPQVAAAQTTFSHAPSALAQLNLSPDDDNAPLGVWDAVLRVWETTLFTFEGEQITVRKVVLGILFLILALWTSRKLSVFLGRRILPQAGIQSASSIAFQRVVFYMMVALFSLIALRLVNVPVTVFTVLGGVLAIGVGFGTQNIVNNFISGWILLAEQKVSIGDLIEIDGRVGHVRAIGARSTHVRRPDGIEMLIPNSLMLERTVINWTLTDTNIRTTVRIGVQYGSPVDTVIELMKTTVVEHERVLPKPEPIIIFEDFGDNALIFDVYFWVRTREEMALRLVRSDVRQMLDRLFKSADITIAFPQRDLHWYQHDPIEVRMLQPDAKPKATDSEARSAESVLELLQELELFKSLDPEEVRSLVPHAKRLTFAPGEQIVRQGEEGSSLFVVDQGLLRVSLDDGTRPMKVAQLLPRQFFGEMSLLTGEARSATVSAVTRSVVYEISHELISPILNTRPEIAKHLSFTLAHRKAEMQKKAEQASEKQASQRSLADDIRFKISEFFGLTDDSDK